MIEKRCGTCKHYKARRKLKERTAGDCKAPVPICARDERDEVYSDDGKGCPAWRLPVPDNMTYGPGGKPKKGVK